MSLVFATNNAHKLEEARKILPHVEILSLQDIGCEADIEETATTLEGNSLLKAAFVHEWIMNHDLSHITAGKGAISGCFADDTGLEIAALGGEPGVYTARWSGEGAAGNRKKALRLLAGQTNRQARFRTVVTYMPIEARGDGRLMMHDERLTMHDERLTINEGMVVVEGIVNGNIAEAEYGEGGFGYDPIFIPEGYDKTFAELPGTIKNSISHRARALQALERKLIVIND